jgi:hypothetical protein
MKLRTLRPFALALTRCRKEDRAGKSSLSKMASILFVFCVAATRREL